MLIKEITVKFHLSILYAVLTVTFVSSQASIEETLRRYNEDTVPYISVKELNEKDNVLVLDARTKQEYRISHLRDAIWVGYKDFDVVSFLENHSNKNQNIVVYCSVGVRSEDIGESLLKYGYLKVSNLYGGIFAWTNSGFSVYDSLENKTQKVHAFGKEWSHLLTNAEKVY